MNTKELWYKYHDPNDYSLGFQYNVIDTLISKNNFVVYRRVILSTHHIKKLFIDSGAISRNLFPSEFVYEGEILDYIVTHSHGK